MRLDDDSIRTVAAYLMAALIAAPIGLVSWLWSGSGHSGAIGFVAAFFPAVISFMVMDIVRDNERRREQYEKRLLAALEGIESKLDDVIRELVSLEAASDDDS
jgi:hypothetical protein